MPQTKIAGKAQLNKKVSLDALWREVLNMFRKFMRDLMEGMGLLKGFNSWDTKTMMARIAEFSERIELPKQFWNEKSQTGFALLMFPVLFEHRKGNRLYMPAIDKYLEQIQQNCYHIFMYNKPKQRLDFFSDPLIQQLWTIFACKNPQILSDHFSCLSLRFAVDDQRY